MLIRDKIYNMDKTESSHPTSDNWLLREAGSDEVLESLLKTKEAILNEGASRGERLRSNDFVLASLHSQIHQRQEEVGIDPVTGPDIPYDKEI